MADVTLTVVQEAPSQDGAPSTPNTGAWPISTTSLKIMAYYKGDTTLIDNYGVDRTTVSNWNNITTAEDDAIVVPVTIDTTRAFSFVVVFQNLSTYNEAVSGTIIDNSELTITQLTATTWSISINDDTADGSITIGDDPNKVEFSPPTTMSFVERPATTRDYRGKGLDIGYLDDRLIDTAIVTGNNTVSDDSTTLQTIQRWQRDRVYIKAEETKADVVSYINWVKGFINDFTQSSSVITTKNFNISILVDEEDVG